MLADGRGLASVLLQQSRALCCTPSARSTLNPQDPDVNPTKQIKTSIERELTSSKKGSSFNPSRVNNALSCGGVSSQRYFSDLQGHVTLTH